LPGAAVWPTRWSRTDVGAPPARRCRAGRDELRRETGESPTLRFEADLLAAELALANEGLDHGRADVPRPQHLGSHVRQRAGDAAGLGRRDIACAGSGVTDVGRGEAEVEHLGAAIVGDHHVGALEVAVHHAVRVRVGRSAVEV
jgi:hypothetical protein